MGIGFDNDLEWLPDGEVMVDGNEPVRPLSSLAQTDGWLQLSAVEVAHRGSADKDALLSAMPETFTRAEYLEKAGEMELGENQVLQWLKRALKKRQVVKVDRATYRFVDF